METGQVDRRTRPGRPRAGEAKPASATTTEAPLFLAPTGLAVGLARKSCAWPWTDKAIRPYDLGPPLLASDEDSAIVAGQGSRFIGLPVYGPGHALRTRRMSESRCTGSRGRRPAHLRPRGGSHLQSTRIRTVA